MWYILFSKVTMVHVTFKMTKHCPVLFHLPVFHVLREWLGLWRTFMSKEPALQT